MGFGLDREIVYEEELLRKVLEKFTELGRFRRRRRSYDSP